MEERLRKFACLVESGSYTKAARELHISQPALSVAIGKLERELHALLLIRGSQTLSLTPAGRAAYAAAQDLRACAANLGTELATIAQQPLTIALGMIDSVAQTLFATAGTFEALEQNAYVTVSVNNSAHLLRSVGRGQLDLAYIAQPQEPLPKQTAMITVGAEPLVVVCHTRQKHTAQQALQCGRLPRFISYDKPSNTCALVREALSQAGITAEDIFYSTSPEVTLQLVRLQKGAAVLPYRLVRAHLANGTLARLNGSAGPIIINRTIVAVHHHRKLLAPPLAATIGQLRKSLAELCTEAAANRR